MFDRSFTTRAGIPARLYARDGGAEGQTIHGAIRTLTSGWLALTWDLEGFVYASRRKHPCDIVDLDRYSPKIDLQWLFSEEFLAPVRANMPPADFVTHLRQLTRFQELAGCNLVEIASLVPSVVSRGGADRALILAALVAITAEGRPTSAEARRLIQAIASIGLDEDGFAISVAAFCTS